MQKNKIDIAAAEHKLDVPQNMTVKNDFSERFIYGTLIAVVSFAAIYLGGIVFVAFCAAITVVMACEFRAIISNRKVPNKAMWYALMPFYLLVPVFCLVVLRFLNYDAAIWLVVTIAASDIGGYAVGKSMGKHKLAPRISPHKTWEGMAGCLVFAAVVSLLYTRLPEFLFFGAFIGLISQWGDLTESAIKRYFGVKDSASIIPGHGGLMDRLDGYLYAAPLALLWQTSGVMDFL